MGMNPAPSRVTIVDIARAAGVSKSTVSLVLQGSPLVKPETRARVQETIREHGYVYHRGAANLRRSITAISSGVPAIRRMPRTSRNASSIDSPSTSGVVSRNTSNTALLASEYAAIRAPTTTASGHSRRASPPPIAVRTPHAFAS